MLFVLTEQGMVYRIKEHWPRIVKNNSNANVYFNYEKLIKYMISDTDRKEFPDVKWKPISLFPTEK